MKRRLKTFLILLAVFLLPTILLLISHIHAKHALEHYKSQLRAAGEKLTIDELLPARVPPEQNGAKLFTQAFPYLSYQELYDSNPPPMMRMAAPGKAIIGWQQPEILSANDPPIKTNSWKDIGQQLKQRAPGLDWVRQASARPALDFGVDYHDSVTFGTTNLAKIKSAALLLSDAAAFDLHHADTSSAVTNLHTILLLVNEWKDERTLISQLVRMAMATIASGTQWELLQATNITDPELAMLQRDWESAEFAQPLEHALEIERAGQDIMIQELRTSNGPSIGSSIDNSDGVLDGTKDLALGVKRKAFDRYWRLSWSYGEELRFLEGAEVDIQCVRRITTNGFFKDALSEADRKISALGLENLGNFWFLDGVDTDFQNTPEFIVPALRKSIDRLLTMETTRRVTITAIALKRYQLRHGIWPADLKALTPEFLSEIPRDPVDGLPLRYRTNTNGTFTLYSIGKDGSDDGGDPTPPPSTHTFNWLRSRDWVWPQPATPEEIKQFYKNLQQPTSAGE